MRITARATQNLSSFNLDFRGFDIARVTVDGKRARYSRDGQELTIAPRPKLRAGQRFTVAVTYAGQPQNLVDARRFPVRKADSEREIVYLRLADLHGGMVLAHDLQSTDDMLRGDTVLLMLRDVTGRQRLENELQAQRLEAIGRLAGSIAHEINTPIQFIATTCGSAGIVRHRRHPARRVPHVPVGEGNTSRAERVATARRS